MQSLKPKFQPLDMAKEDAQIAPLQGIPPHDGHLHVELVITR